MEKEKKDINKQSYLSGLLLIMNPINLELRSWIQNLTC